MSEQINYIYIDNMINVVYKNCWDEYPKNDKSLDKNTDSDNENVPLTSLAQINNVSDRVFNQPC